MFSEELRLQPDWVHAILPSNVGETIASTMTLVLATYTMADLLLRPLPSRILICIAIVST